MRDHKETTGGTIAHPGLDMGHLAGFAERQYGADRSALKLQVRPLRGGLQAAAIARVRAQVAGDGGASRRFDFVVKRLDGELCREATAYQALQRAPGGVPAPRLLEVAHVDPATCYLYLEAIAPWRRWPWADLHLAGQVMDQLAALHDAPLGASFAAHVAGWDYEQALAVSARTTLEALERIGGRAELRDIGAARPAVRRIVAALPAIRRALLAGPPGACIIHGDVHPGNVLIRGEGSGRRVVLLDWANTRIGSPLEDVGSWLQWLGYWVPRVPAQHDLLLRRYLAARGMGADLGHGLREGYWLAGACNALAGVLRIHLETLEATQVPSPTAVAHSARAARDCLRVLRRADIYWRGGTRARGGIG